MDFRPVWAQLCFAAAAGVLWDCWVWKRADFGKTRAEIPAWLCKALLPACKSSALVFGCKGIFPSAETEKNSVFLLSLGDPHCTLKEKTLGKTKLGYLKESGFFFGKEESVFLWSSTTLENNHPLNTFFLYLGCTFCPENYCLKTCGLSLLLYLAVPSLQETKMK